MNGGPRLDSLNRDVLAPIVARIVGGDDIAITEWTCCVVKGDWGSAKRLVCRVFGECKRGSRDLAWSVFLKVPNPTHTQMDPWHREPFQREVLLYESGLLGDLPGRIAAPQCLGVTRQDDDQPWLWLEDVVGEWSLLWPLKRFRLAAYHLGLTQGAFLAGRALPDYPWLDTTGWLRQQLAAAAERVPPILDRFACHPLTRRTYYSGLGQRLQDLWNEREVFFRILERMPRSLCHGDFNYLNLLARPGPDRADQTVLVDWQYAGRRQIGGDVAGLIADSSICPVRREAARPEKFAPLLLDGYLSGLRRAGWEVDAKIPRFSVLVRLAWTWSFNLLLGLNGKVLSQEPSEANREELRGDLARYVRRQEFLLSLAEEARRLRPPVERIQPTWDC